MPWVFSEERASRNLSKTGSIAARVFPVPVGAMSRTFSPLRIAGMESSWIGLASRKPSFSSLFRTGGFRTEKAELGIYRTRDRCAVHKPSTGTLARLTHEEVDQLWRGFRGLSVRQVDHWSEEENYD